MGINKAERDQALKAWLPLLLFTFNMRLIGPATPGFLSTLAATVLLGIVSFCVPYFKSVFFLKAGFQANGQEGTITFGTLGFCLEFADGTTCSKPQVGYQLGA